MEIAAVTETVVNIFQIGLIVFLFALGAFFLVVAAICLRIAHALTKIGPKAADDAANAGASLKKWWQGKPWGTTELERRMKD